MWSSCLLTSTCFVLLELSFLLKFFSLSSKSISFTKSATSALLAKFAWFNVAAKFYAVNLLNSVVVIYASWLGIFFSTSSIFVLKVELVTNPLFYLRLLQFLYLKQY